MNSEDKAELLRVVDNAISMEARLIMENRGKLADVHRERREWLVSIRKEVDEETDTNIPVETRINVSIPADSMPMLLNCISKMVEELASKPDLLSKKAMLQAVKLQIAMLGGRE